MKEHYWDVGFLVSIAFLLLSITIIIQAVQDYDELEEDFSICRNNTLILENKILLDEDVNEILIFEHKDCNFITEQQEWWCRKR